MAINKVQIMRVADKLEDEGIKVTMASVREALGAGSFGTISPVLRERRLAKEKLLLDKSEMPEEVRGALDKLGSKLWKISKCSAEEKALKVQTELSGSLELKSTERNELLQEIDELEKNLLDKENNLKIVQRKLEGMEDQVTQNKILLGSMEHSLTEKKEELNELQRLYVEQSVSCGTLKSRNLELERKISIREKDLLLKGVEYDDLKDFNVKGP